MFAPFSTPKTSRTLKTQKRFPMHKSLVAVFFLSFAARPVLAESPSPILLPEGLELVAAVDAPFGNLTVTNDRRIIVSLHQHFQPEPRVAEIIGTDKIRPFPNEEWNDPDQSDPERLDTVLGVQFDTKGVVWMLDNGMRSGITPKLVGWHLDEDRLYQVIEIPEPVSHPRSFFNDLAVDRESDHIFIADPMGDRSALVVVDVSSGNARRVLEGHVSVVPEDIDLVINQRPAEIRPPEGEPFRPRVGVNPIALDAANEWLYFGPMHGTAIYRARTRDLIDASLSADELAERVERFGNKPISDGSSVNNAGYIYITDIGNNAIGAVTPQGSYRQLFQDDNLLLWPDAFAFGPDNFVYVVVNQLHLGPVLNAGNDVTEPPFLILRFHDPEGGVIGR